MQSALEKQQINKEVWQIGLPAIAESLFTTFSTIIDTKMVSALGITAISAVSVTNQPRLFLMCIFFALNMTVSALVARYKGAGDRDKANGLFASAMMLSIVTCVVISVLAIVFAWPIMQACSGQADTMEMSVRYFRIMMAGLIFNIIFMLINSALRGCGYTKITLTTNIVSCVVNIFCNYLFIEGHWGFPRLEIRGAALATVLGNLAAMILCYVLARNEEFFVNISYIFKHRIRLAKALVVELYDFWRNICIENLLLRVGILITSMITARIGSYEMSIHSIGITLMNITFSFGDGLQSASVALISRSIGENRWDKVIKYSRQIQITGLKLSIALGVIYAVFGKMYYGFFSTDPDFTTKGAILCIIIAIIGPIQVAQIIYNGVLKSMGQSKLTLISAVVSTSIVNPIVAWLFAIALHMGLWGCWIGILISQFTRMFMLHIYYRKDIVNYTNLEQTKE